MHTPLLSFICPAACARFVRSKRRLHDGDENEENGYNSEDEYNHFGVQLTEEEWIEKDRKFEQTMGKKGYIIKKTVEDGSCLFRAVADQIYGDQEMHVSVRKHCMDYLVSIFQNNIKVIRGKSLLKLWVTTFLPD